MKALATTALVLSAIATGVLATKPLVARMMDRTAIHNGPWRTSVNTGSAKANLYERAAVAVAGLYALAKEETVYYTAFTDSEGRTLDGACRYRLEAAAPESRWWSLTLYGADHYLLPNPAGIYSRHAGNLVAGPDGRYVVEIGSTERTRNWLPSPPAGPFSITLRLYNPGAAVTQNLAGVTLPALRREGCP